MAARILLRALSPTVLTLSVSPAVRLAPRDCSLYRRVLSAPVAVSQAFDGATTEAYVTIFESLAPYVVVWGVHVCWHTQKACGPHRRLHFSCTPPPPSRRAPAVRTGPLSEQPHSLLSAFSQYPDV